MFQSRTPFKNEAQTLVNTDLSAPTSNLGAVSLNCKASSARVSFR